METKTRCGNCGSVWTINVVEGAEITAELNTCPLCGREDKETE